MQYLLSAQRRAAAARNSFQVVDDEAMQIQSNFPRLRGAEAQSENIGPLHFQQPLQNLPRAGRQGGLGQIGFQSQFLEPFHLESENSLWLRGLPAPVSYT